MSGFVFLGSKNQEGLQSIKRKRAQLQQLHVQSDTLYKNGIIPIGFSCTVFPLVVNRFTTFLARGGYSVIQSCVYARLIRQEKQTFIKYKTGDMAQRLFAHSVMGEPAATSSLEESEELGPTPMESPPDQRYLIADPTEKGLGNKNTS